MKCYHRTGGIGTSFAMVTGVSRPSPRGLRSVPDPSLEREVHEAPRPLLGQGTRTPACCLVQRVPFAGNRTWDRRGTALALGARASTMRVYNYH